MKKPTLIIRKQRANFMGQQIEQFPGKYMTCEKYFQGIFESLNLKYIYIYI